MVWPRSPEEKEVLRARLIDLSLTGSDPMALSRAMLADLKSEEVDLSSLPAKPARLYQYLKEGNNGDRQPDPRPDPSYWILTYLDPDYPALLREMADPPAVLYGRGQKEVLSGPCLTMVGTRKASNYGLSVANRFARNLASAGLVIVSGLALGIDGACHRGALEGKGRTLAVMACGIDRVYPASHRNLAERICREGGILTEYPPGSPPLKHHFMNRNRILSGLSMATLVVEARDKSGTMITSRFAGEQGRDLFAIPGNINQPRSSGCNWLIQQGAMLAQRPSDILMALKGRIPSRPPEKDKLRVKTLNLPKDQVLIYDRLSSGPMYPELLIRELGGELSDIWTVLTLMEMKGIIEKDLSGRYQIRERIS
ncbi:DNA-processing protein DprA [Kallipyga massiliensis]|uniref:DNA-processing protein DprA n=1 Tax=Kallipyga massiliensis TaxID=1472764 RepID=UPI0004B679EF|nr:DNA-processing protein DprA [Kallipyga massiliensis]